MMQSLESFQLPYAYKYLPSFEAQKNTVNELPSETIAAVTA